MIDIYRLGEKARSQIIKEIGSDIETEKKPKYRNKKTRRGNIVFDSKKEAERYDALLLLQRSGAIKDLRLQVKFRLIEPHKREDGKTERAVDYIADFVYFLGDKRIVEDVKGKRTREYIIKRKLLLEKFGITIKEI